jgi:hypothetical protein
MTDSLKLSSWLGGTAFPNFGPVCALGGSTDLSIGTWNRIDPWSSGETTDGSADVSSEDGTAAGPVIGLTGGQDVIRKS